MSTAMPRIGALVVAFTFAASACAHAERSGSEPSEGSARPQGVSTASVTIAGTTSPPALWEPIDNKFTGCDGG
jgi:hypothetical protein